MEGIPRKILCMGMVALLLLSLFGTGVAAAQEVHKWKTVDKVAKWLSLGGAVEEKSPDEAMEVPIIVVYRGHGFALKVDGEEFHMLRIYIVRVRQIEPIVIRELMEEDKSIEEIRGEIIEKGQTPFYQGYMRFAEEHYRLVNISLVTEAGDNFTINADVMVPLQDSEPSESAVSVGNISVTVMDHEGVRIGEGELTMHGEEYQVLLNVLP